MQRLLRLALYVLRGRLPLGLDGLGSVPDLADPTPPLTSAVSGVTEAVSTLSMSKPAVPKPMITAL